MDAAADERARADDRFAHDEVRRELLHALGGIGLPTADVVSARGPAAVDVTPAVDGSGLVVAWHLVEDLPLSPAAFGRRNDVLELLNLVLGDVLTVLGWDARPRHGGAEHLVTGCRPFARPHVIRPTARSESAGV